MTDPVADMLTRIRNAGLSRLERVEILKQEGFVLDYRVAEEGYRGTITVDLRYDENRKLAIKELNRLSKPGRRIYASCDAIPQIRNGLGICIVSTSQGMMTDKEARRRRIGGELVCSVW
jgi:small subunit ribosomal protein S8